MSLPEALERAAMALESDADAIRPANGDPDQLLGELDPDAAVRVLEWLLVHESAAAEELAAAWSQADTGRAALTGVDEAALPKPGRKALRRIRHRLRSSGEALPEAAPAEPVVARVADTGDALEMAFVSALDPRGSRLVYLVESNPGGGARMFEVLVDAARGIADFDIYHAGRSKVRQFLKALTSRPGMAVCEAEPEAARALVARHAERHPVDRPWPGRFAEWRARIVEGGEGAATPAERVAEAFEVEASPALLRRAVEQVRGGSVGPWPPAQEELTQLAERLKEGADSGLVLTPAQRRERTQTLLEEQAGSIYAGEFGGITAERWRDQAYVSWKRGDEEEARAALAAARAFEEEPPSQNEVAVAMLEAAMAPVVEQLMRAEAEVAGAEQNGDAGDGEGSADSGSLIVEP